VGHVFGFARGFGVVVIVVALLALTLAPQPTKEGGRGLVCGWPTAQGCQVIVSGVLSRPPILTARRPPPTPTEPEIGSHVDVTL
jgi:hypothetical protein